MLAGMVAAVVFAISNLPMVWKALRTRDVGSYSLGSIGMINAANVVYSLYVFTLPPGPIWMLHSFYVVASAIMLVLCLRARSRRAVGAATVAAAGDAGVRSSRGRGRAAAGGRAVGWHRSTQYRNRPSSWSGDGGADDASRSRPERRRWAATRHAASSSTSTA
ncbi:hypothetical protein GCM10009819_23370 [Agromyces tropicus]|uniref:PQ-loop repeat-containing protein n=2 Tax=Agromyces tropicus TaxID=555371 RepID=A0ABP5G514_9MICO